MTPAQVCLAVRHLSIAEARRLVENEGCILRIERQDGHVVFLTDDCIYNRINVTVVHGQVVDARIG